MTTIKPTGIILVGGQNRRFGSNKALYCINELTLIDHAINALKPCCGNIIISGEEYNYNFSEIKCISDHYPSVGPLSGICSTIETSPTEKNIVLNCDMPFISTDLVKILIKQHKAGHITIFHTGKDTYYPFPMVIDKSLVKTIRDLIEKTHYKIRDLLNECIIDFINVPESLKSGLTNINHYLNMKQNPDYSC